MVLDMLEGNVDPALFLIPAEYEEYVANWNPQCEC
jgi:hypothetical protein